VDKKLRNIFNQTARKQTSSTSGYKAKQRHCRYVSLHYDTIHDDDDDDDNRTDNGKALVHAKSKQNKANNFYRREEGCRGGVLVLVPFTSLDKWGALQTHDERKEYKGGVS
jgi:hypothetical protein